MKPWQIATGLGALGLLGVAVWLFDPLPVPQPRAEAVSTAAGYQVDIVRDQWGTPHIYGRTDADTAFGLAYAHAEDDFETIQEVIAATRGTLARYRGAGAAPTDYIAGLVGVWPAIEAKYETEIPADVRAAAAAYADGLNLYAAQHPHARWAGLTPFTGQDVVAGFVFKTPFFYGLDTTLLSLFGEERTAGLALDPAPGRQAWLPAPRTMAERGSNAFAIAPQRSTDGRTRLVINSHQPMTGPVAWYEAHIVSDEGLDVTGGVFPGTPFILHGFNAHLGWANTVSAQDLVDVYQLTRHPTDKSLYKLDGDWVPFSQGTVKIRVKLFGPFAFTAKRPLLHSAHGPVIEADHGTYAVRYAGMGEVGQLEQYYRLNQARTLDEFMAAMALNAIPAFNYIYADQEGHIGMIHNAKYPNRLAGWDWSEDLPGDRSDLIWQDYLPFSLVPKLMNPQSGFVFEANNTPFTATDGPDNLQAEDFPAFMGLQTNQTNRALRLVQLTDGMTPLGRDDVLALKFDTGYAPNSAAAEVVAAVLAHPWPDDPDIQAALDHLRAWNFMTDKENRHAALGVLTTIETVTAPLTGKPAPAPATAFEAAIRYLARHHGRLDPEWGAVSRLVRGPLSLPVDGAPDTLRAIYPAEIGDDGVMEAAAGDTWMAVVEWDAAGAQTAQLIHNFGSATLDDTSPHYADQAPLFAAKKWRPALRDEAMIRATGRTYRPQDAN